MSNLSLIADPRTITGRKVKALRRDGLLPANIFGKKVKSQSVQISVSDFNKLYQEAGETHVIELQLKGDKDTRPVLITNLQVDPVTDTPLHVDFHQVDLKEKVTATVPVETSGEAPAVKEQGGVLFLAHNELEVEALPMDLPDNITIDISGLSQIGDSILVKDLKLDRSKVTLKLEDEETMVAVQAQQAEEEVAAPVPAEGEVAAGEAAPAEADKAVEGEAKAEGKKEDKPAEAKEAKKE